MTPWDCRRTPPVRQSDSQLTPGSYGSYRDETDLHVTAIRGKYPMLGGNFTHLKSFRYVYSL